MAEETEKKQTPIMDDETRAIVAEKRKRGTLLLSEEQRKKAIVKKKKGWFHKIPADVLLSPAGMVLIFLALIIEIIDWIPLPLIDQIIELPLEIIFIFLLTILANVPLKASVIPFIIERIPIINDLLPTWLIRMIA